MIDRIYDIFIEHGVPWWVAIVLIFPLLMLAPAITGVHKILTRKSADAMVEDAVEDRRMLTSQQQRLLELTLDAAKAALRESAEAKIAIRHCENQHSECERRTTELERRLNMMAQGV